MGKVQDTSITGKTETGFEFTIDTSIGDDWEVLELVADASIENPLALFKLAKRMLGEEQYSALKEHVRDEEGRVSTEKMSDELISIFSYEEETKN